MAKVTNMKLPGAGQLSQEEIDYALPILRRRIFTHELLPSLGTIAASGVAGIASGMALHNYADVPSPVTTGLAAASPLAGLILARVMADKARKNTHRIVGEEILKKRKKKRS